MRTDHRDAADLVCTKGQLIGCVFKQDRTLLCDGLGDGFVVGQIERMNRLREIEETGCEHGAENAVHHVIQAIERNDAGLHLRLEHGGIEEGAERLLLVKAMERWRDDGSEVRQHGNGGDPVRHDKTLEAPFAFEDVVEQVVVGAGVGTVHQVIGAHHGLHAGFFESDFEGEQVALAGAALIDDCICIKALCLLVVEGEVLDVGQNVLVLDAAEVGRVGQAGEDGIFSLGLKGAARPAARGR